MTNSLSHTISRTLAMTLILAASFGVTLAASADFDTSILTAEQQQVLEEAKTLRESGDHASAKELIDNSGIKDVLKNIRSEQRAERQKVKSTIAENNYEAFLQVAPDKLLEKITSIEDFALLQEAHQLRENGDKDAAREIMEDLGFEKKASRFNKKDRRKAKRALKKIAS